MKPPITGIDSIAVSQVVQDCIDFNQVKQLRGISNPTAHIPSRRRIEFEDMSWKRSRRCRVRDFD
jgi:hypothetical protein